MALALHVSETVGEVEALLLRPDGAKWLMVLAHGAGAGMHHPFMEGISHVLAECSIATLRYQFPYMQQRRGRPDVSAVLIATVRAAVKVARQTAADLPLLAGGKSLGGRMTSLACGEKPPATDMAPVRGLVFFGFPLHEANRPSTVRAEHLTAVQVPMLFLQGTRDPLADLSLLRPVCAELAPRASLHVVDGGDHSFHVLKRSGRTETDVLNELGRTVASWADALP